MGRGRQARLPHGARCGRGATLVEYALGVSLILGGSIGAMSAFEEESEEAFVSRGNTIGAPDLDTASTTTTTASPPTTNNDATTTTSAPPLPPVSAVVSATSSSYANGNKWTATVVIEITDGNTGNPVHKAAITAVWNPSNGSPTSVSCETQPNGTCTFTLRDLGTIGSSHHVATVSFVVTGVTPEGGTTTDPGLEVIVQEPTT